MPNTISNSWLVTADGRPKITLAAFVLLFMSIAGYVLTRGVFIAYAQYGRLEKALAVLFFLAETFIMLQAVGFFSGIVSVMRRPQPAQTPPSQGAQPAVAVLIPARHEPREVLENTLISCYNLVYPHKTLYLLDDSTDPKFKEEAEQLARKYNAKLFRREERHGAKAGVINDCLRILTEKYVAIFDADQNPLPVFLSRLVPMLESNPRLAFVQTPQFYSNAHSSRVAFGANMQQAVFYEYVCEAKSSRQAMICCGTNVVLRREALKAVGGLDESTVTEDFATSLALHQKGWTSLYDNQVFTFGMGPQDLGAYFKQQARWAMGNVGILRRVLLKVLLTPRVLRSVQWWEYLITGSYYLVGWAYLFLLLCPVVYLFFNIPSFFMDPAVYGLAFFPYLVLSYAIFYTTMVARRYSFAHMFKGQLLSFLTLPVYMRSSLLGLAGIRGTFAVTAKSGSRKISYLALWPQLAIWAVCLAAVTWGLNRFYYERSAAVMINVLWSAYHCTLLSSLFYYNE